MAVVKTAEKSVVGVMLDCMLGTPGTNLGLSLAIKTKIFFIFLNTK
jgi:hypothetical protein